jgi:hypothetical protein
MANAAPPTAQQVVNALAGGQELNAPPTALRGGDYWVGSNGHVYVKSAGVTGANGAAVDDVGSNNSALLTDLKAYGASQISDPNPGGGLPAATGGGGSGSSGGSSSSSSGGGTLSQSVIDAVMQSIANDIAQNNGNYATALATNKANQANGDARYATDLTNNTEGRAQSIQQAEQAGAQGLQGLRAVLASLGALNGTGSILAGRAVGNTTNNDIGSANQTFNTNKQAITNAQGEYDTGYNQNNANLRTALDTDNKSASATGYQDLLDQANSIGDTSLYSKYLPLAVGATTPTQAISPTVIPISQASTATYGSANPFTVKMSNPVNNTPIAPAAGVTPTNSALAITKNNS